MLKRKPQSLSGGQRQRVALGRAIVRDPKVFLFDEPLSNLDAKMRVQMRTEISRLHAELKTTMIYVTHDQVEAMTMGDRICVMREGVIMQTADPLTLYRRPDNLFVAGFIGSPPMNLLSGRVERHDSGFAFVEEAESNPLVIPLPGRLERVAARQVGRKTVFGVRPEHLSTTGGNASHLPVSFTVELAEPLGGESIIYLKAGARSLTARIFGEHFYRAGEKLELFINMEKAHLFDAETGNAITEGNSCQTSPPSN